MAAVRRLLIRLKPNFGKIGRNFGHSAPPERWTVGKTAGLLFAGGGLAVYGLYQWDRVTVYALKPRKVGDTKKRKNSLMTRWQVASYVKGFSRLHPSAICWLLITWTGFVLSRLIKIDCAVLSANSVRHFFCIICVVMSNSEFYQLFDCFYNFIGWLKNKSVGPQPFNQIWWNFVNKLNFRMT